MKKVFYVVLLIAWFSLVLGGAALATDVGAYELKNDVWVTPTSLAKCFATGHLYDACNKKYWNIPVTIHASVAQWIEWDITGTRWDWYVMKPGKYAADCITFLIASNQEVGVTFSGFGNLMRVEDGKTPFAGQDTEIEIYYAAGEGMNVPPAITSDLWVPADELYDNPYDFVDSAFMHEALGKVGGKLWCYINVERCNSACEYENAAQITLTLKCQKTWVNDDGTWGI